MQKFISQEQVPAESAGLRVSVLPGGCSGFKYSLNIEERPLEDDMVSSSTASGSSSMVSARPISPGSPSTTSLDAGLGLHVHQSQLRPAAAGAEQLYGVIRPYCSGATRQRRRTLFVGPALFAGTDPGRPSTSTAVVVVFRLYAWRRTLGGAPAAQRDRTTFSAPVTCRPGHSPLIVATETSAVTVISLPASVRVATWLLQLAFGYLIGRIGVAPWLLPGYFRGDQETAYARLESRFGVGPGD